MESVMLILEKLIWIHRLYIGLSVAGVVLIIVTNGELDIQQKEGKLISVVILTIALVWGGFFG